MSGRVVLGTAVEEVMHGPQKAIFQASWNTGEGHPPESTFHLCWLHNATGVSASPLKLWVPQSFYPDKGSCVCPDALTDTNAWMQNLLEVPLVPLCLLNYCSLAACKPSLDHRGWVNVGPFPLTSSTLAIPTAEQIETLGGCQIHNAWGAYKTLSPSAHSCHIDCLLQPHCETGRNSHHLSVVSFNTEF